MTMETTDLKNWAEAQGPVEDHPDKKLSLSSKLLRFRWNDGVAVGVGSDAPGKVRINAVLDGLAYFTARRQPSDSLHVILGTPFGSDAAQHEQLGAIATLCTELRGGPEVRVWSVQPGGDPVELPMVAPTFTTDTPSRWNKMLMTAATAPITGMAAALVEAVRDPRFALYPKLSSLSAPQPWQMRVDGLEIGRTGHSATTLKVGAANYLAPGEPRATWRKVVGAPSIAYPPAGLGEVVDVIHELIAAWTDANAPAAVLRHGQAEHALEAHVLSGRLQLSTTQGALGLAVPFRNGMLGAAQFPTLWGDVTGPARYLDALLADREGRPWAVELKDQATGGHGAYLRHGIGQAVLYRHFIRSADQLHPWFMQHGLARTESQAALAFPNASPGTAESIARLRALAHHYDVEVIEFARPGSVLS